MDCAPISKILSLIEILLAGMFKTSDIISTTALSVSDTGGDIRVLETIFAFGNLEISNFPVVFIGNSSICAYLLGTI